MQYILNLHYILDTLFFDSSEGPSGPSSRVPQIPTPIPLPAWLRPSQFFSEMVFLVLTWLQAVCVDTSPGEFWPVGPLRSDQVNLFGLDLGRLLDHKTCIHRYLSRLEV